MPYKVRREELPGMHILTCHLPDEDRWDEDKPDVVYMLHEGKEGVIVFEIISFTWIAEHRRPDSLEINTHKKRFKTFDDAEQSILLRLAAEAI